MSSQIGQLSSRSKMRRRFSLTPQVYLLVIVGIVCAAFMSWLSTVAMMLVVYCFTRYVRVLGTGFAFAEMIALIAVMQWLLGPLIAYYVGDPHYKFHMYVDEEQYMRFAVPAVLLFVAGVFYFTPREDFQVHLERLQHHLKRSRRYGIPLIMAGLLLDFGADYVPRSLLFVVFLVAQFKYIGVLYLLVGRHPYRWFFLALVLLLSIWISAETGLFHNLILWSAFIFSYLAYTARLSNQTKYAVIIAGVVAMVAIQTVKAEYREKSADSSGNRVILLVDMIFDPGSYTQFTSLNDYVTTLNRRLNQGWIISAVLKNVPARVDFENGKTFVDALSDSLVPRFLVEKRSAKVSVNFKKYTGLQLAKYTSMGISILGEAYVNFAVLGGIIFMGFWGFFISWFLAFILNRSDAVPTILLWIPLIFLQMVKAETEMVVVLNHGFKSALVVFGFYLVARGFLGWRV